MSNFFLAFAHEYDLYKTLIMKTLYFRTVTDAKYRQAGCSQWKGQLMGGDIIKPNYKLKLLGPKLCNKCNLTRH